MKINNKRIHFIGIGGIGMSGLARFFKNEGKEVSGSDITETGNTKKLITEGIPVTYNQTAHNIRARTDLAQNGLVVYSEAVGEDNEELKAVREAGIRTVNYFEALGEVTSDYYLIAVAGTHGKTTTTAMLIDILEEASFDPTAIVGALRTKTGSNFRAGKSKYFVVEACEYKRDFLTLKPNVLVITNLELEHVDYYKDLKDVQSAFHELVERVSGDGAVVVNFSDENIRPCVEKLKVKVLNYKDDFDPMLVLPQPGIHNYMNAAAARSAAVYLGIEEKQIINALENFAGTKRRFEYKGACNEASVYDDYAHHPTEIKATISAVREKYPDKKMTVIFQPHTFSRTTELFTDFVEELSKADHVILVPIYAAREKNESGVSSSQLTEALLEKGAEAKYFATFEKVTQEIKKTVSVNNVVVIMGAGDVTYLADSLINNK